MSATIIQQGRFTSDGTDEPISIRSDADWMEVINETQWATTQTPGRGVKFEWQRGLDDGEGFEYTKADGANTLQGEKISVGGFTLSEGAGTLGPPVTGTTITKADPPVCTAAGHGFQNGDVVIFSKLTNMTQFGRIFFTIDNVTTNTFEIKYFNTNTANFTAETSFEVRKVSTVITSWSNSNVAVSAITKGSTTQVETSVDTPDLTPVVGDVVRFVIPSVYGMTEINNLTAKVTAYNSTTNIHTLDINSSAFTDFAYPANTAVPFSLALLVKVGNENTSPDNPTENFDDITMNLGAGIDGPAGSSGDVIYWKIGKSFSVTNE